MAAISETLRQARLRSGIDLDRLADKTKINPRYLKAIEAGDFAQLPSGIFARMFVKQYADAVGLDGASFAEEFQRSTSFGEDPAPDIRKFVETSSDYHPNVRALSSIGDRARSERLASMLSSFIWAVGAVLVCAGAYYLLAHLPSRPPVAVTQAAPPQSSSGNVAAAKPPVPPVVAPVNAASPAPTPAVEINSTPNSPIQLAISTSEPVWVSVTADGKTVLSELVPPGAGKIVAATTFARVVLGNAGAAEITFNGKKLESFGAKGDVRTVIFTPQNFQVISRTSPNVEPSPNPDPLR